MRHLLLRGRLPSRLALATKSGSLHTWQVHPFLVSRTRSFICRQSHSVAAQAVDWEKLDTYRRNWLTPANTDLPIPVVIAWLAVLNIPVAFIMYYMVTH